MNSSNENILQRQFSTMFFDQTIIKEFDYHNIEKGWSKKIQIQIQFTSDQKIIYSSHGSILRVVQIHDVLEKPETFNNLDQIRNLSWQGQFGKNKMKDGKWIAFWNKKLLKNVGGYYQEGYKQGQWKDLFLNYSKKAEIFETGEYFNGFKIGKWSYIYYDEKIVGGFYNKNGQKQGKWVDLDEGNSKIKKVTYNGIYNMNGMKVGKWEIMYRKHDQKEYKQMYSGGGLYNYEGNQKKIEKLVELDEYFFNFKQITYNGEYNLNGMRVGSWDIMYCKKEEKQYKQMQVLSQYKGEYIQNTCSGGGLQNNEGNQKKVGKWVELDQSFVWNNVITQIGEYNMKGQKEGIWVEMGIENQNIGETYYYN